MSRRLGAALAGCLMGLVLAEAGARLLDLGAAPPPPPVERNAPPEGASIRRWPVDGAAGPRVVVVGDSFTFGAGVAEGDAYPARLAEELARREVNVISYSRPGWNTRSLYRSLREDFVPLAPDLLVVGHCLNDAEPKPTQRMLQDRPDLLPWEPRPGLESRLARLSRLYVRLRQAVDRLRRRPALRAYYRRLYQDPANLAEWRQSLVKLRRLAESRSVPAVLVVFPIFDSDLGAGYPYAELHRTAAAIASEVGFRVLDLRPAYQGHPARALALVPFSDPHPSALAHRLAAGAIAVFLEAEGLLEPPRPAAAGSES